MTKLHQEAAGTFWAAQKTAREDGTLVLWDVVQGTLIATHEKHSAAVRTVVVSENGKMITTGSEDQTICQWGLGPA